MTGQPSDKDMKEKQWDDKTRALAAALEVLLELHRDQARNKADGTPPPEGPGAPALEPR